MKAHLINMHLQVPRSRSSAKVKVKYKGYISQKMAVSGAFVFHKHILFFHENVEIFLLLLHSQLHLLSSMLAKNNIIIYVIF